MLFTLMRGVVVLVPMFYVLPVFFPEWGIWAAIPLSEAVTLAAICMTYFYGVMKRRMKLCRDSSSGG
ncbi:MAG: hypothetical protein K2L69_02065, partial [Muribaculaceae bacterium]|nr:hypothetical protein [Muribaculaceae bacterium]